MDVQPKRHFLRIVRNIGLGGVAVLMVPPLLVMAIASDEGEGSETKADIGESTPVVAAPAPIATNAKATCGPDDQRTNRDYSVIDSASLQTTADPKSPAFTRTIMNEQLDATIDESVPVRELCRSRDRSLVRILLPEELRKHQGWVPSNVLRKAKTRADGSRVYNADYFEWMPEVEGDKALFVKMANRIVESDKNCEAIDPVSPIIDAPGLFSLICVGPRGSYPVTFTSDRIIGGKPPLSADVQPISKADAFEPCADAITQQLAQPRSIDFHLSDRTYSTDGGRARFAIGLSAKNGMGLPIDAMAECMFEGETLTSAAVIQ